MEAPMPATYKKAAMQSTGLPYLFNTLREKGYTLIGPTLRQGAIVYDEISSVNELPIGWTDVQDGGNYRLKKRPDNSYFGFNVGPHSWKKFLFPSHLRLWQAKRNDKGFEIVSETQKDEPKYAFLGVRACELHAIEIQDKVFMKGEYIDPTYRQLREKSFIIAVNCVQAGGTCFCASMKTGPKVTAGFDLSLTELIKEEEHIFLVETGSEKGAEIMNGVPHSEAREEMIDFAELLINETEKNMGRTLNTNGLKELLYESHESAKWEEVSNRCLSCGNCTMVCPTCFCSTVEDVTDLKGDISERWRKWDSCFNIEFSHIHGGNIRSSVSSRYRQWITHKLASWIDQFGTSGCVGCGRCITWCPVAIDITQEVATLRQMKEEGKEVQS